MKILHTSDWHLGRPLYGRKRYDEFTAFLDWLAVTIEQEQVNALIIAGDIFDNTTPSNRAQELYYGFLHRISQLACCRHVIIVAGNHDSPSFLDAPKPLLKVLNVHVVGDLPEDPADEVIVLRGTKGEPEAIICAVPYLHDRDLRTVEAGETIEAKNAKLAEGIRQHYERVCQIAEPLRQAAGAIPIIATGHLFTAGGTTVEGDGVRELYVGSLAHVEVQIFPAAIDYLALGHLHVPQIVGLAPTRRYSGSPIPMGYGEARQQKIILLADFTGRQAAVRELPVPCFQKLERIQGPLETILERIAALRRADSTAWLEVEYTGTAPIPDLREQIDAALQDTRMECHRIRNQQVTAQALSGIHEAENLDDLDPSEVFDRCLDAGQIQDSERVELVAAYMEILRSLQEADQLAE
ncbi:MAG: exonuclease SbcCD subunit D C-terminal domain-containing protein [Eubacteriales bacterium]|nr:exonuclease SbcCD subunit D C-terminal domain-containing protein [Eubacteriales bacterium]